MTCSQEPIADPCPEPEQLIVLPCILSLPSSVIPLDFLTEILYAFLFFPVVAVCPIMRPILVYEEYKLWSSPLYSFLQPHCSFLPLRSRYSPQSINIKHWICILLTWERFTPIKSQDRFVCFNLDVLAQSLLFHIIQKNCLNESWFILGPKIKYH